MPHKRTPLLALTSGLLMLVMTLAACGPTAKTTGTTSSSGPKSGGTAIDGLYEEPDSLLPEGSVETYSDLVDASIWAPLFYGTNTFKIMPGLATEVPTLQNGGISKDLKTYTIHLRSGLKWSDGSPLTIDDVAFSLNLFKNPAYGAKSASSAFAEIANVTTQGTDTVVITLSKPDVTFLAVGLTDPLAFAPLPKSVFGSMDPASIQKSAQNFKPTVTSGPFTVSDRVQGDHINTVKNKYYYQAGKPYLNGVNFKIIPDQNTILTALQGGTITNSWFLDVTKLATYKQIQGYNLVEDKAAGAFEAIVFNETNPILDASVRKALTMSADPSQVISKVLNGTATATCDDSVGTFAHEPSLIPCYKYDQKAAGDLLTQDGWTMGSDGYRHKGGKTLELTYSTTSNNTKRSNTQQIFQAEWKQVGIKVDIKDYPANTYFGTVLPKGQFDLGEFEEQLGYDPNDYVLWDSQATAANGGQNYGHYSNPIVDKAIATEQSTADQSARMAAFHTEHVQILKDNPVFYLYAPKDIAMASVKLHNYAPSAAGPSETWNIWDWYLS